MLCYISLQVHEKKVTCEVYCLHMILSHRQVHHYQVEELSFLNVLRETRIGTEFGQFKFCEFSARSHATSFLVLHQSEKQGSH